MYGLMQQLILDLDPATRAGLDNFVPGDNRAVLARLRALGAADGGPAAPIYLWGPRGSGKTHLLRAAARVLIARGASVGWLDASRGAPAGFDPRWQAVVMDDVDRYDADQQHAAFDWFIQSAHPRSGSAAEVLAAGCLPPTDLALRDDLRSRLGWGDVYELHPLSDEQARCALRAAAQARGFELPDPVLDYLFSRFPRDMSSQMAMLERARHYGLEHQRPVTVPMIRAMSAGAREP